MGASPIKSLLIAALLLPIMESAPAQTFTYTDLGNGKAYDINDAGIVAGIDGRAAVIWTGGSEITLSTPGQQDSMHAINDGNVAVGYYSDADGKQALLWNGFTTKAFQDPGPGTSAATGINNASQVVGYFTADHVQRAVMWTDYQAQLLGTIGKYNNSVATDINNSGQESGYVYRSGHAGKKLATLWTGTTATLLGELGNQSDSEAIAINDAGQEAGFAKIGRDKLREAVLWNGATPQALASLGGNNSSADGINNSGAVVGYSTVQGSERHQAVLWINGTVINLNTYLPASAVAHGWYLKNATAINNGGTIVGIEENLRTGRDQAFELNGVTMVPEPAQYGLLLAGLGLIGLLRLRRPR